MRLATVAITMLVATLIATQVQANNKEEQSIHIVCGYWPNFCNKDGNGFYFSLLREIFALEGYSMTHANEPFKRALISVSQGKADAMPGAFLTPSRAANYTFPNIRITTEYTALLYRKGMKGETNPFKISGPVVKIRGYDYTHYQNPNMTLIEVSKSAQGIEMVANHRADYFMNDYQDIQGAFQLLNKSQEPFKIEVFARDPTYVVFQKNQRGDKLKKVYEKGIRTLYKNGRLKALLDHYQLEPIYYYYPEISNTKATSAADPKPTTAESDQ